jgi:hypothetical protein
MVDIASTQAQAKELTLVCILKHCWNDVPGLYDIPNSTSLAQQVVPSLVVPITKIFIIENHKSGDTFLHVIFRSQSRLRKTSDLTRFDTN